MRLLFLLFPLHIFAQNISGTVTDFRSGELLIGANIAWKNTPNMGTQTDLDGTFQLEKMTDDSLIISYIGYRSRTVAPQENMTVRLRAADVALGTITVKAARLVASEFATEQLTKLDIYLNPNSKADVLLAVDALPASTNTDESANISLRGSSPAETGILLNNVPLDDVVRFDQTNGIGQFSIFNTAIMKSVNVFPSNPPLEFGNATAGVVALYTDNNLPQRSHSLGVNLVGLSGLIARPFGKKTGLTAYANFNTHRGLKALNTTAFPDLNGFLTLDAGVYLLHKFSAQTSLKVFNFSLLEQYDYQFKQPSYTGNYAQNKQRNLTITNLVRQGQNTRWEWNQSFNFTQADYGTGNLAIDVQRLDYYTALQGAYFIKNIHLKAGVSAKWNQTDNSGQFPQFGYAFAPQHPSITFDTTTQIIVPEGFAYAKYEFNPAANTNKWTLGGGLRFQAATKALPSSLSSQINLNWQPQIHHRITFATGKYHKVLPPGTESDQWNLLQSFQIALDYQYLTPKWTFQTALYHKQNQDRLRENDVQGAEIFLAYKTSPLEASISLASIHSIFKENEIDYPSPHDLSYFLRAYVQYKIANTWTIGALYKQRQGRYYQPILSASFNPTLQVYEPNYASISEGERLPDYHLLDVSVSKLQATTFGSMIIYASANNVFNFNNIRSYNYNQDYSEAIAERYGRRVIFFGAVLQW